jgi:hypothetical protein
MTPRAPAQRLSEAASERPTTEARRRGRIDAMIVSITRWSLAHKRLVVLVWLTVTAIGIGSAGAATKALSDQYSVPAREGYQTTAPSRRRSEPAATALHSSRW